ncbi:hypothetical protein U1Q18_052403 [Sarracenia purpurea var. burkii]
MKSSARGARGNTTRRAYPTSHDTPIHPILGLIISNNRSTKKTTSEFKTSRRDDKIDEKINHTPPLHKEDQSSLWADLELARRQPLRPRLKALVLSVDRPGR